jgi:hypothetical protein
VRNKDSVKKYTIQELCMTWIQGISRKRFCTDEEYIGMICELIQLKIRTLEEMKMLLYKEDYYRVLRYWNKNYKYKKH